MPKKAAVTIPPELLGFAGLDIVARLERHQRDAVFGLVGAGALTPAEAGALLLHIGRVASTAAAHRRASRHGITLHARARTPPGAGPRSTMCSDRGCP